MNDKEAKQFYDSAAWKHKRMMILERDHYECVDCRQRVTTHPEAELHGWERKIHKARQVHHIQELKDRPDLALDDDNLVSLCVMCHNIRHGRNPFEFRNQQKKKRCTEEMW